MFSAANSLLALVLSILLTGISTASYAQENDKSKLNSYLEEVAIQKVNDNSALVNEAFEKTKNKTNKFWDKVDQLNISFTIKETLKIFKGLGLGLQYKYGVEPAFIGDYFLRKDSYKLKVQFRPTDLVDEKGFPWLLEIEPGTEINFWQFLPTAKEARKVQNGYTPARFPLSAQKAIDNLKPGDLAHTRAYLNLNVGVKKDWDLAYHFEARTSLIYTISGWFDIFVFRAEDNKIRLRLIAQRNRGLVGKAEVGLEDDFKILGWEVLDNGLVRWTDSDKMLALKLANLDQNIFLGDYTLDFQHQEVRDAYDQLFARAIKFKGVDVSDHPLFYVWSPTKSREEVRNNLISNLSALDELYRQDLAQKDRNQRRVERNFSGSNNSDDSILSDYQVGISGIARLKNFSARRDNGLAVHTMFEDGTETIDRYFFPSWIQNRELRALFSLFKEETFRSVNMIYNADAQFRPTEFKSIGFYYEYTDKMYENEEHQSILTHFEQILPESIYQDLITDLRREGFDEFKQNIKNIKISSRYFVSNDGLEAAEKTFENNGQPIEQQMRSLIFTHLSEIPKPKRNPRFYRKMNHKSPTRTFRPKCQPLYKNLTGTLKAATADYCEDIEEIASELSHVINLNLSAKSRHEALDKISTNHLFRQIGPGLILRAIPQEALTEAAYFEIKFYLPSRIEPLTHRYPKDRVNPDRQLYETILDIQNLLDNVTPDMRLEGDVDSLTTRKTDGKLSSSGKKLKREKN